MEQMTPEYYFNRGWWLRAYGQECGPFNSRRAAERFWDAWLTFSGRLGWA